MQGYSPFGDKNTRQPPSSLTFRAMLSAVRDGTPAAVRKNRRSQPTVRQLSSPCIREEAKKIRWVIRVPLNAHRGCAFSSISLSLPLTWTLTHALCLYLIHTYPLTLSLCIYLFFLSLYLCCVSPWLGRQRSTDELN